MRGLGAKGQRNESSYLCSSYMNRELPSALTLFTVGSLQPSEEAEAIAMPILQRKKLG